MPTYRNTSNSLVAYCSRPPVQIQPRQTVTLAEYIRDKPPFVELLSHAPLVSPWTLLSTVASFPSAVYDVVENDEVVIYNAATGAITVEANGDTANSMILPPGTFTIKPSGYIGALKILSRTGTGSVYMWGLKEER